MAKGSDKPFDFEHYWEAPAYYWQPREMSDREMEAVMVGLALAMGDVIMLTNRAGGLRISDRVHRRFRGRMHGVTGCGWGWT